MIVTLPWPSTRLSPNARLHWGSKAFAVKKARETARLLTLQQRPFPQWDRCNVSITFYPPDHRARDLDNMLAANKAHLDGIASAIGVDDSRWTITISVGHVVKGGAVQVELTEA